MSQRKHHSNFDAVFVAALVVASITALTAVVIYPEVAEVWDSVVVAAVAVAVAAHVAGAVALAVAVVVVVVVE